MVSVHFVLRAAACGTLGSTGASRGIPARVNGGVALRNSSISNGLLFSKKREGRAFHSRLERATVRVGLSETYMIQPDELRSEHPYGPWSSRGCDVWEAIRAGHDG